MPTERLPTFQCPGSVFSEQTRGIRNSREHQGPFIGNGIGAVVRNLCALSLQLLLYDLLQFSSSHEGSRLQEIRQLDGGPLPLFGQVLKEKP